MPDTSQELFDIVDENNEPLGKIKLREQVHRELKDWHRTNGIYIVNNQKQLLCQKRSMTKDANPGMWTAHFGGHLQAGQSYTENAVIELKEELGLSITDKELIPLYLDKNFEHKHFCQFFVYRWKGTESDVHFDDGEVDQVKWLSASEFELFVKQNGRPNFKMNSGIIEFINRI